MANLKKAVGWLKGINKKLEPWAVGKWKKEHEAKIKAEPERWKTHELKPVSKVGMSISNIKNQAYRALGIDPHPAIDALMNYALAGIVSRTVLMTGKAVKIASALGKKYKIKVDAKDVKRLQQAWRSPKFRNMFKLARKERIALKNRIVPKVLEPRTKGVIDAKVNLSPGIRILEKPPKMSGVKGLGGVKDTVDDWQRVISGELKKWTGSKAKNASYNKNILRAMQSRLNDLKDVSRPRQAIKPFESMRRYYGKLKSPLKEKIGGGPVAKINIAGESYYSGSGGKTMSKLATKKFVEGQRGQLNNPNLSEHKIRQTLDSLTEHGDEEYVRGWLSRSKKWGSLAKNYGAKKVPLKVWTDKEFPAAKIQIDKVIKAKENNLFASKSNVLEQVPAAKHEAFNNIKSPKIKAYWDNAVEKFNKIRQQKDFGEKGKKIGEHLRKVVKRIKVGK